MNLDRRKKISLIISVIFALILFFGLNLVNLRNEKIKENNKENNNKDLLETELVSKPSTRDTILKENKSIYNRHDPGKLSKVYINVFSTEDKDGSIHNFSDLDLMANWNEELAPILDASVQFVDKDKAPKEKAIRIPNASIRVRGNPSVPLKSYRIKLMDDIEGFEGQTVLNLNKSLKDPSRIANKLAHDLILDVENISAFRTSFLEVFIRDDSLDGEYFNSYGLYTHIEQPNKTYLRSRGLDVNGSIYRAKSFDFSLSPQLKNVNDEGYDEQSFEAVLDIREGNDHTKLLQMLKDINDESKDFAEVFHTYFDEDNYLTWLSINILLGNVDSMSEGFLLYNPSDSLIFYLLPWEFDGIFKWMEEDDTADIYDSMNSVVLHRRYLQMDGSVEKLKAKVEELYADAFSSSKVKALIKNYKPILLEMMDQFPDYILTSMELNEQIAYLGKIDNKIVLNYREFIERYE